MKGIFLYTDGIHDIITINIPNYHDNVLNTDEFYFTLKESILQGIEIKLNLDDGEIDGYVYRRNTDPSKVDIIIYENAEGGVGLLPTLFSNNRFETIISKALELLHDKDSKDGCIRSCYECLLNFYNQREHDKFDRKIVLPLLRNFTSVEINKVIRDDYKIHFDYLLSRCQSDFERSVLHDISKRGLPLPNECQKTIFDKDEPIAQADFFYSIKKIIVFVDGSPHRISYIHQMDEVKRNRLKSMSYIIYSIRGENMDVDLDDLESALYM